MNETTRPEESAAPIQIVSPAPDGAGQLRGLAAVDLQRLCIEEGLVEIARQRLRDPLRVGDHAVAHQEGALGRLDDPVHVIEALGVA